MKIKLLALLLFPLALFGANTNQFDNVWIKSSFRMTAGTPGVGKAFISDANGFGTWTTISTAGGDVFTQSNNTFVATKTNTFNGLAIFSNMVINATISQGGNTRWDVPANIFYDGGWPIMDLPGQMWKLIGGQTSIQFANRRLIDSSGVAPVDWEAHTISQPWTNTTSLTVLGVFSAQSNVTLGAQAGNTITVNASTMTLGSQLNIQSGTMIITNGGVGFGVAPGFPLQVKGIAYIDTNQIGYILELQSANSNFNTAYAGASIYASDGNAGTQFPFILSGGNLILQSRPLANRSVIIVTGSPPKPVAVFDSNQRLGLGSTNAPTVTLDVSDSGIFRSNLTVVGSINSPSNIALWTINNNQIPPAFLVKRTNGNSRLLISSTVQLIPTVTESSSVELISLNAGGTITNRFGPITSGQGLATTNAYQLTAFIQPGYSYFFTNESIGSANAFVITNSYSERIQ